MKFEEMDEEEGNAANGRMKQLSKDTIARIQSDQVVVDIVSAVKELLEYNEIECITHVKGTPLTRGLPKWRYSSKNPVYPPSGFSQIFV